jgi:hypothetical protein
MNLAPQSTATAADAEAWLEDVVIEGDRRGDPPPNSPDQLDPEVPDLVAAALERPTV